MLVGCFREEKKVTGKVTVFRLHVQPVGRCRQAGRQHAVCSHGLVEVGTFQRGGGE